MTSFLFVMAVVFNRLLNSLFETYPGFSDWINGKVSSIGSFQKELVYKYCSGGIIGEDGKSHKIWDYLDLN